MAPGPAGDGAEAGPLTSATPALPGRSPKPRISYSIEYATTRLIEFRASTLLFFFKKGGFQDRIQSLNPSLFFKKKGVFRILIDGVT